jgi:hypothetical protein
MTYEFKCTNKQCVENEVVIARNISYDAIPLQCCEKCTEPLTRVYSFRGGILTSDGYKG